MKRILKYSQLLMMALLATSCSKELIDVEMGDLEEIREELKEVKSVSIRCTDATDGLKTLVFTHGERQKLQLNMVATSTVPVTSNMSVNVVSDAELVKTYSENTGIEYKLLPGMFYRFEEGNQFIIPYGATQSPKQTLSISNESKYGDVLTPGNYLLPLVDMIAKDKEQVYIEILVREKFEGDYPLYQDEDKMFFVFYLNTGRFDPRLVTDFYLQETRQDWEAAIGNILNLRKSVVTSDEDNNPVLVLYPDLKYVLENRDTYILPVQESGRKVCLCIEGGGKGLGFCNLTEDQIESLTDQIIRTLDRYHLQGVNLWDRGTNYGLEGMPEMNTTSYPQFIKRLREKLGSNRILTLVDFEEPTASFWDKAACGGIEVGQYIDYAWSGYNKEQDGVQVIDPYHQGMEGVSIKYPRKPILGLTPKKYGCVNVPWFGHSGASKPPYEDVKLWEKSDLRTNAIFVYEDISSNIQGSYEQATDPGKFLKELFNAKGQKPRIMFQWDVQKIYNQEQGAGGYGKWKKNW